MQLLCRNLSLPGYIFFMLVKAKPPNTPFRLALSDIRTGLMESRNALLRNRICQRENTEKKLLNLQPLMVLKPVIFRVE